MLLEINGIEYPAFHFIMRREIAQDILDGYKKVEFRSTSPHNLAKVMKINKKTGDYIWNDIGFAYFTNYNKTWFMVVRVETTGIANVDRETAERFKNDFGTLEVEQMCEGFEADNIPEDERPQFLWLTMDAIVDTNLEKTPGSPEVYWPKVPVTVLRK